MNEDKNPKTCTSCRAKKLRCDGGRPACGRCVRTRGIQCVYESPKREVSATDLTLQKGAACLPCRSKKKKCDARKPFCRVCEVAGKEKDCRYPDPNEGTRTQRLISRISELEAELEELKRSAARSESSSSGKSSTQEAASSASHDSNYTDGVDMGQQAAKLRRHDLISVLHFDDPSSASSETITPDHSPESSILSAAIVQATARPLDRIPFDPTLFPSLLRKIQGRMCSTQSFGNVSVPIIGLPTKILEPPLLSPANFDIKARALLQRLVAPRPGLSLVVIPRNRQDSRALRMEFIKHRHHLGLDLSVRKLAAIQEGDLSGTVVHPVLIHLSQIFGSVLSQGVDANYIDAYEAGQAQVIINYLSDEAQLAADPTLALIVATQFGLMFANANQSGIALFYITMAARLVSQYNLRVKLSLVPQYNTVEPLTLGTLQPDDAVVMADVSTLENWLVDADDLQEHNSALCQHLFLDYFQKLEFGLYFRVEPEARYETECILDHIHSLPALRLKSILTLFKARQLTTLHADLTRGTPMPITSEEWFMCFWELLASTTQLIGSLRHLLTRCAFYGKLRLAIDIRTCLILANTTTIEMHQLMIELHSHSRRQALNAIDDVIDTLLAVDTAEFNLVDPVVMGCLASCSRVLGDIEANISPAETLNGASFASRYSQLLRFQRRLAHVHPFLHCWLDLYP